MQYISKTKNKLFKQQECKYVCMCINAVKNSNKNSCQLWSHSVPVLTQLFINTYTLRAVPEHAMGWEQWWERKKYNKLPTNWHYNKIYIKSVCWKSKLTAVFNLNTFFQKSKLFPNPEPFSLSDCIYYPTTEPKTLHSLPFLFTSSLCLSRHG